MCDVVGAREPSFGCSSFVVQSNSRLEKSGKLEHFCIETIVPGIFEVPRFDTKRLLGVLNIGLKRGLVPDT